MTLSCSGELMAAMTFMGWPQDPQRQGSSIQVLGPIPNLWVREHPTAYRACCPQVLGVVALLWGNQLLRPRRRFPQTPSLPTPQLTS
jgi:hypothetical protein